MIQLCRVLFLLLLMSSSVSVYAEEWLSKKGWKLVSVDSEETVGEDGKGINAFDSNADTIWHTEWKNSRPLHPHEIVIDLGAAYSIDAFNYLPRQTANMNHGQIKKYQYFITEDLNVWGTAVAAGEFGPDNTGKSVVLTTPKTGRYVKLQALSEINGKEYTSVAELGVRSAGVVVNEFTYGKGLKVTISPSPDVRVTGYNFYITNTVTNESTKVDLKTELSYILSPGVLSEEVIYKFTATAYGLVAGKLSESVHSNAYSVKMVKPVDTTPLTAPWLKDVIQLTD